MNVPQPLRPVQAPPGGGGGGGSGLGTQLSDPIGSMTASAFDTAMQKVWDAGIGLLRGALTLADDVASITPSSITGDAAHDPAALEAGSGVVDSAALWPSLVWLAAVIALGLFFYQLISVAARGGRGMFRAFTGPVQFGVAITLTTGAVATLLTAADGLTTMFLSVVTEQGDFASILDVPTVADRIGADPDLGDAEARPMLLGLAAFFGTIPAGIGFALLMVFRQAAVLVLIATIPIAAAALVADSTASIFWRSTRWIVAAVLVKPALALVLVVGVDLMARAEGVAGLLAGTAVLLVSLACPVLLFRLLAFVDPDTSAGAAVRSRREWRGLSEPGSDNGTTEAINTARFAERGSARRSSARETTVPHGGSTAGGARELGGTTAVATRDTGRAGPVSPADGTGSAAVPAAGPARRPTTTAAAERRRPVRAARFGDVDPGPRDRSDQPRLRET
jgi:hypothetical protein